MFQVGFTSLAALDRIRLAFYFIFTFVSILKPKTCKHELSISAPIWLAESITQFGLRPGAL